ncbi:MAG: dephospho-CoA kinase [Ignavibacteriaceae bacterium]
MKNGKLKIAITGGIGSGKSAFSKFILEESYPVINVDDVSKEILVSDKEVKLKIEKEFGKESFKNGEINKKFLSGKVFSNPHNVIKINSIVHPGVIKKVNILISEKLKDFDIAFAEAALIYEAGMDKYFDYVVLITAEDKLRLKRKVQFDNFTEDQFLKRDENQIPDIEKKKRADFVFENNGSLDNLKTKANFLLKILNGLK